MREIFKSGSVRGLIATLGLLPQKKGALWALLDRKARGGGGGGAPHDYDDASFSDIEKIVVGTDINDPNDYPGEHVATQTSATTTTHTPAVMPTPVIPRLTWAYYLFLTNTIVASIMIGLVTFYYFFKQPAKKWQAKNSK